MKKFTSNDLLLYVLNELDSDTRNSIEMLMQDNLDIKHEVEQLQQSLLEIESISLSPHDKVMEHVFNDLGISTHLEMV